MLQSLASRIFTQDGWNDFFVAMYPKGFVEESSMVFLERCAFALLSCSWIFILCLVGLYIYRMTKHQQEECKDITAIIDREEKESDEYEKRNNVPACRNELLAAANIIYSNEYLAITLACLRTWLFATSVIFLIAWLGTMVGAAHFPEHAEYFKNRTVGFFIAAVIDFVIFAFVSYQDDGRHILHLYFSKFRTSILSAIRFRTTPEIAYGMDLIIAGSLNSNEDLDFIADSMLDENNATGKDYIQQLLSYLNTAVEPGVTRLQMLSEKERAIVDVVRATFSTTE